MQKIQNITTLEQGSIGSKGNQSDSSKIRSIDFIPHSKALTVEISATSSTENPVYIDLLAYDSEMNLIFDRYWYVSPYKVDLTSVSDIAFFRIVLKYNTGKLTTEEITSCQITEFFDWYVNNGELICENMPEAPEKSIVQPYPKALWRVENGRLTHKLLPDEIPEKEMTKPYPKALWRIDNDILYHELLPSEKPSGAFMNAVKLEYVRIPTSVRKIGRYAFTNTALRKVSISSDCEYLETSFPENCLIEFYGESEKIAKYGQLYDSNGYVLIDDDSARIYAKE